MYYLDILSMQIAIVLNARLKQDVSLVCTSKDRLLATKVSKHLKNTTYLTCFWNIIQDTVEGLPNIAPITRIYQETGALNCNNLVLLQSYKELSCIKTNLMYMLDKGVFNNVFIVYGGVHHGTEELNKEFPTGISMNTIFC